MRSAVVAARPVADLPPASRLRPARLDVLPTQSKFFILHKLVALLLAVLVVVVSVLSANRLSSATDTSSRSRSTQLWVAPVAWRIQ